MAKASRRGNPPGTGRPKAKIDWEKVKLWLRSDCTGTEIAGKLGIAADTLYINCERDHKMTFSAWSQEFREYGKLDLRLTGYDEAIRKRNTRVLIHLHQWTLGQREQKTDGEKSAPLDALNDKENENMFLKAKLAKLEKEFIELKELLDNKSQTRPELCGSDPQIQHMGGGDQSGQDIQQHSTPDL